MRGSPLVVAAGAAVAAVVLPLAALLAALPGPLATAAAVAGVVVAAAVVLGVGRDGHRAAARALRAGVVTADVGVSLATLPALAWPAAVLLAAVPVRDPPALLAGAPAGRVVPAPGAAALLQDVTSAPEPALLPGMAALLTVAAIAVQDPGRGDAIGVPWWSRRLPRSREPDGLRVAADRWCGLLVPAAVLLALAVTGFRAGAGQPWTAAVPAGLAVLLAACPVALLAAVPAGVRAADRAAGADVRLPLPVPAGTGWLDPVGWTDPAGGPRPADRVDTVALAGPDVLTGSGPGRVTVHAASGEDPAPVLRLAGSVAAAAAPGSALAPVARALAAAVPGGLPDVAEPDEQPGLGASGLVAELVTDTGRPQEGAGEAAARAGTTVVAHAVLVGSPCWLLEHGIRLPPGLAADRERAEAGGRAVVAVAWDGAARAVLALSRAPHPAVRSDVDALRAAGTEPVLLTPDGDAAARALGAAAGLDPDDPDAVRPGLGPACRAAAVAGLQVRGRTVAVAADPGTDEAALARADLAIELVPAPGPDGRPARIVVRGGPGTVAAAVGLARRGRVHARTGIVAATAVTVLGTAAAVAGAPAPLVALGPLLGAFAVRARRLRIRT